MNFDEFSNIVADRTEQILGNSYKVQIKEVRKNNGTRYHGLLIHSAEGNLIPTIYLEPFWNSYENGMDMEEVISRILEIYQDGAVSRDVNMDFFQDFKQVRERICYRLINKANNEELLSEIPHIDYLDLAICFYYAFQDETIGDGSILIYNSHLKMWKVGVDELYEYACRNTRQLFPESCISLGEVLAEHLGEEPEESQKVPMSVLTNSQKTYGATVLLYPGVMEQLSYRQTRGFYVIPSSIHEGATC